MADENYTLPEVPVYREAIRKILNEDPVNADGILNPLIQALLENIHFVKLLAEAESSALDDHTGDNTAHLTAAERAAWNGKAAGNHSHTAADVGARPSTWTPSAADVGAVPTSRKVNGKALSADISLSAADVSARSSTWTPSAADVGAIPTNQKGVANGVATLGTDSKIPSSQLPAMNYIPTSQKASANGVATLGSDAKVPKSQLPEMGVSLDLTKDAVIKVGTISPTQSLCIGRFGVSTTSGLVTVGTTNFYSVMILSSVSSSISTILQASVHARFIGEYNVVANNSNYKYNEVFDDIYDSTNSIFVRFVKLTSGSYKVISNQKISSAEVIILFIRND